MYGGWSIEGLGILGLGSVHVSHWNSPISIVINANLMQLRIDNCKTCNRARTNAIANAVGEGARQGATYTKYIDLLFVIDCAEEGRGSDFQEISCKCQKS